MESPLARRIRGFEKLLGIHITLNDLTGSFAHLVSPSNLFHDHPFCIWVKGRSGAGALCGDFDNGAVVRELGDRTDGFVKYCHGGIAEVSLPLMRSGAFVGYLAAGPYRWMFDTPLPLDAVRNPPLREFAEAPVDLARRMPILDSRNLPWHMEVLRSLADTVSIESLGEDTISANDRNRKHRIEFYVGKEFHRQLELEDLAGFLNLSSSRAGTIVRDLFGMPFTRVLQRIRIQRARNLLENSLLTVASIATLCGYPNQNYMYRLFRKHVGCTPLEYRRETQRELSV